MLSELKFVQGSVARKDFNPALVHFHIHNGRVQGYNGVLSISSPIALDLDVTPNAVQLIKAVRGCQETMALSMTSGGRLSIKSGRFKAFVDCHPGGFPEIHPSGVRMDLPTDFLLALKLLAPYVAEDASRQWARGVLFRNQSAFATNNVVLLEYYLGSPFPTEVNIPSVAIDELLRIGESPEYALFEENAVTFMYPGDRWLRSQLYTSQWPDLAKVLDGDYTSAEKSPITEEVVEALRPFVDESGRIHFRDGMVSTHLEEGIGATLEVPGVLAGPVFNVDMLRLVASLNPKIDYSTYPGPCRFVGDSYRGAIIGMRS